MHRYPDVWIGCSYNDMHIATELIEELSELGITTARVEDADIGSSLLTVLKEQQSACRVLVYLLSPDYQGPFLKKESAPWLEIIGRRRDPTIFAVQLTLGLPTVQLANFIEILRFDATGGMRDAIERKLAEQIAYEVRRPRCFICHASEDRDRIDTLLSTQKLDANVWFDSQTVPEGVDVSLGIRAGVARASCFIAFVAASFVNRLSSSTYLQLEIALALQRELRTPGFAVLYALDPCFSQSEMTNVFSWARSLSTAVGQSHVRGRGAPA